LRVVVTGANGAIGRWVVRELGGKGHDVVAVDRRTAADDGIVSVDLEDAEATVAALAGAEALVHLAAVPGPRQPPWLAFDPNVQTTFHVLEAARVQGLRCAVLASSIWAYGYNPPAAERLPRRLPLEEDDVVPTVEGYGLSKRLLEQMGREYAEAAGLQVVCMRYPWVVQPEEYRGGPLGDPASVACRAEAWSYVDVRDVALACRLAVERRDLGFATVNVGAADTRSALPSAELVRRYAPQAILLRPLAEHEALYSIRRARELLDYAPRHSWRGEAGGA
jgi:nucleoside-diphosphate-sugar epimerase